MGLVGECERELENKDVKEPFVLSRLSAAYIAAGAIIVRRNPRGPPPLLRSALSH